MQTKESKERAYLLLFLLRRRRRVTLKGVGEDSLSGTRRGEEGRVAPLRTLQRCEFLSNPLAVL